MKKQSLRPKRVAGYYSEEQLRRIASSTTSQKLQWLEEANQLVEFSRLRGFAKGVTTKGLREKIDRF